MIIEGSRRYNARNRALHSWEEEAVIAQSKVRFLPRMAGISAVTWLKWRDLNAKDAEVFAERLFPVINESYFVNNTDSCLDLAFSF